MKTVKPFEQDPSGQYIKNSNYLYDDIMPTLSPAEWMVLSFIIRKTTGYQKDADDISISQIQAGTGIKSHNTIETATKRLGKLEYITIIRHGAERKPNTYKINTEFEITTMSIFDIVEQVTMSNNDADEKQAMSKIDVTTSKNDIAMSKNDIDDGVTMSKIDNTKVVVVDVVGCSPSKISFQEIWNRWDNAFGEKLKPSEVKIHADIIGDFFDEKPDWTFKAVNETLSATPLPESPLLYFKRIINGWITLGRIPEREPAPAPAVIQSSYRNGKGFNNGHHSGSSGAGPTPEQASKLKQDQDAIRAALAKRAREREADFTGNAPVCG